MERIKLKTVIENNDFIRVRYVDNGISYSEMLEVNEINAPENWVAKIRECWIIKAFGQNWLNNVDDEHLTGKKAQQLIRQISEENRDFLRHCAEKL